MNFHTTAELASRLDAMSDRQISGAAILATSRHTLTGREISICERMESGDYDADEEMLHLTADATRCPHCGDYVDEDLRAVDAELLKEEGEAFRSLEIQLSREIGEWIDNATRTASRRAVAVHDRLNCVPLGPSQLLLI